ncbi:MAG: homoserine dehydrogenase, partial [Alphaproteobacteria bacterium]
LLAHADRLAARCGRPIEIAAVSARERGRDRGVDLSGISWEENAEALAENPGVDVVVELIGGAEGPARALVEKALSAGKPVVTANKALLALHGARLDSLSAENNAPLRFEAAVAGGIPIIKALREGLVGNDVSRISGILNGTCNYILSTMEAEGRSFENVLAEAQKLGYAEADPAFDISGADTAHKLAILARLGFGAAVDFDALHVEGITRITPQDITFARELGYRIKLLGIAEEKPGGIAVRVHPALVRRGSPIAEVFGVMNAALVEAQPVDRMFFEGPGAGAGPTASAVLSDIADLARGITASASALVGGPSSVKPMRPMSEHEGEYYVRLRVLDQPGVMARITQALARAEVSLQSLIQRGRSPNGPVPIVMRTHEARESVMLSALAEIGGLDTVVEPPCLIRIEDG